MALSPSVMQKHLHHIRTPPCVNSSFLEHIVFFALATPRKALTEGVCRRRCVSCTVLFKKNRPPWEQLFWAPRGSLPPPLPSPLFKPTLTHALGGIPVGGAKIFAISYNPFRQLHFRPSGLHHPQRCDVWDGECIDPDSNRQQNHICCPHVF